MCRHVEIHISALHPVSHVGTQVYVGEMMLLLMFNFTEQKLSTWQLSRERKPALYLKAVRSRR